MSKRFICCDIPLDIADTLHEQSDEDLIFIFKALSHPLRLKIVKFLTKIPEICTCEFDNIFHGESQPQISKQLKILLKNNILRKRIIPRKEEGGRWHAYRINEEIMQFIKSLFSDNKDLKLDVETVI